MARNEEKQLGRLNRLWLQRERDEGRLRDAREQRPRLSALNSASSVKRWIPSIKNEIEYYLQQSQLPHYPERKIAEFQLHIEALEKQYKSFVAKLRALDPTCKHKPWTPRAYCRRRADTQGCPSVVDNRLPCEAPEGSSQWAGAESACSPTECHKTSGPERLGPLRHSETRFQTPVSANPVSETSEPVCADQDQPLSFDHTRLAVATAAFRGPSIQRGSSQTQSLVRVLQSGLPNLINASVTSSTEGRDTHKGDDGQKSADQDHQSDCEAAERIPGKSSISEAAEERTGHLLGLDCYSSSEEEEEEEEGDM